MRNINHKDSKQQLNATTILVTIIKFVQEIVLALIEKE